MKRLRWGILGTATIAKNWIIPALRASDANELTAIASRDLTAAQAFAQEWHIPTAYGSYDALLADPDIDAIYNPLPNHLHVPLSIKALQAGKHVLCEKPMALNAQEARGLLEVAAQYPRLLAMEAFMYRFHPQWKKIAQIVDGKALGNLLSMHAQFTYPKIDAFNIRNRPEWGGGGLMDIGSYCVSVARLMFDAEPQRVCAQLGFHPEYGVDVVASGIMQFPTGNATFSCATEAEFSQGVFAVGELASVFIENPFVPPRDEPTKIIVRRDTIADELEFDGDHYMDMFDAFAQAIDNCEQAPLPLTDSVVNMSVIDAIFASAKSGQWVDLQ